MIRKLLVIAAETSNCSYRLTANEGQVYCTFDRRIALWGRHIVLSWHRVNNANARRESSPVKRVGALTRKDAACHEWQVDSYLKKEIRNELERMPMTARKSAD